MSDDAAWDVDKHREEHESEDHWELRRKFMMRWRHQYDEERLVCLARVFANIELLGCRYPAEVMQEVARLSHDVAKDYRNTRKDKLKRTFVSASDAAEDRARGVKREGGIVVDTPPNKSSKYGIQFVKQGENVNSEELAVKENSDDENNSNDTKNTEILNSNSDNNIQNRQENHQEKDHPNSHDKEKQSDNMLELYFSEMNEVECLNVNSFNERMFNTEFGRMVLLVRPWTNKLSNIQASCQTCGLQMVVTNKSGHYSVSIGDQLLAQAQGVKAETRGLVEKLAWDKLRRSVISVVVKELFIAQDDSRISARDVAGGRAEFGAPLEIGVAAKMMKLMGWQGGGLGAAAQGIAEPIKPNFQMVNRAGLGSEGSDVRALRRNAQQLMQRYKASDSLDVDLVFSAEFAKEERALLHQMAQKAGLVSRSYGKDDDRFLVVRKRLDPFSLVRAVLEKGGNTAKYQVFIPAALRQSRR